MLKRMVNALRGSVRLEVSGAFPERFLNLCAQRGIVFWNVEWLEATRLRLTVTRQGSGPARALGDKVLCTVVPAEQSGVPFFLGRFRRRYALLVGLALSLTAVCVLSQFVLTIEVEGNEAVSTAEILTELRRQGLRPGVYGPGLDEGTISSAALLGLPELAWMSVNLHGTRAEVLVREAVPAPEVDDEEQVGSIVARSSGIVTHIEPLSGEALVAQGDTVLAGEVLISGADTSYLLPKHPDYVDHIRYFVGNHITRVKRAQDIPEDILKVSAYCRDGAASHAQTLGAPWKAAYSVAVAGEKWLDFTRADKGTGLAALCGELGVRPQEVIAFGDNFNDVPMLDLVGSPYIMQGAVPALRERYPMQCARVEDVLRKLAEG